MHRFLHLPQNVLLGLYYAYWAPSSLSGRMRVVLAALPALFNKRWLVTLSHDELMQYAHMRSAQHAEAPPPPAGVTVSTTDEFDDLLAGCDGKWTFYLIKPSSSASPPSSHGAPPFMLYLHGGAYVSTAQPAHFTYLYDLCARTGSTILVPIYPRPPHAKVSHKEILDVVGNVTLRLRGERKGEASSAAGKAGKVVVAGDSAGGGMALGLALWLIKESKEKLLPDLMILNAPWLDVSLSSPELDKYDKLDPWLPIPYVRIAGELWAGSSASLKAPLASPLYASKDDLAALKASKMRIAIFQGEADLTCPDTLDFVGKLREAGIPLDFVYKAGVPHVYPILPPNIKEAEEARSMMASLILS